MAVVIVAVIIAALRVASFYGIGPLTLFTPLGAMAIFGGAYFSGWLKPFLLPLLTLFISDVIVSFTLFAEFRVGLLYAGWFWTYAAFALMVVAAKLLMKYVTITNIVWAIFAITVIHWLVSNFGMCIQENRFSTALYAEKLRTSFSLELRLLAGTAVFSVILFGGFALLTRKFPALRFNVGRGAL
jgi:hypothetical protein